MLIYVLLLYSLRTFFRKEGSIIAVEIHFSTTFRLVSPSYNSEFLVMQSIFYYKFIRSKIFYYAVSFL